MKKLGYSVAVLSVSVFALMSAPSKVYATDAGSQAEIAALKAQLEEMAQQQKKAAAVIEKLAAEVDKLQKQNTAQASQVSVIQKQQQHQQQQITQAAQATQMARVEPAAGGRRDDSNHGGGYLGLFGGWGTGSSTVRQTGTVFFLEAAGGPQAVSAKGRSKTNGTGVIGMKAGYEWSYDDSRLLPAAEIEALYLPRTRQKATLVHNDARLTEHLFNDSLPTGTSVVLANAIVGFKTPYQGFTPYLGAGVGAAYISVKGASSTQHDVAEPGVNHFNGEPDTSVLTAAAQLKAGLRMNLNESSFLFSEYRYLYVGANDQTFGSTIDAGHSPTSPWTISSDGMSYNLVTAGLGVRF